MKSSAGSALIHKDAENCGGTLRCSRGFETSSMKVLVLQRLITSHSCPSSPYTRLIFSSQCGKEYSKDLVCCCFFLFFILNLHAIIWGKRSRAALAERGEHGCLCPPQVVFFPLSKCLEGPASPHRAVSHRQLGLKAQ